MCPTRRKPQSHVRLRERLTVRRDMPGKNGIPDAFAEFNTGFIVYRDDLGDYATNEHIMDGTANLALMLSALDDRRKR